MTGLTLRKRRKDLAKHFFRKLYKATRKGEPLYVVSYHCILLDELIEMIHNYDPIRSQFICR